MPHERLRRFNTRTVYPGVTIDNDMCMIVKSGRHVLLRGPSRFDLDGSFGSAGWLPSKMPGAT